MSIGGEEAGMGGQHPLLRGREGPPAQAGRAEQGGVVWGRRPLAGWVCPAFNLSEMEN